MAAPYLGAIVLILTCGFPGIVMGNLIAYKNKTNLIAGWHESLIADPRRYAKVFGWSVIILGLGLTAVGLLLALSLISEAVLIGSTLFFGTVPIAAAAYCSIKYKK